MIRLFHLGFFAIFAATLLARSLNHPYGSTRLTLPGPGRPLLWHKPQKESVPPAAIVFEQISSTAQGRQLLRDTERQQAQQARLFAQQDERKRLRVLAEKDSLHRQAFEARQRFSLRLSASRVEELALWASSRFQTTFTCDLDFTCVPWQSLAQPQLSSFADPVFPSIHP
jgi:hypothetical protein